MSSTNPTDTLTEWDELQIKYGNYTAKPKTVTNEMLTEAAIDFAETQDPLANKSLKQLEKLEDSIEDDILRKYREKRLQEMRQMKESYKFGDVVEVIRSNYIEEITDSSKKGHLIILHLYSPNITSCLLINKAFIQLAKKHGYAKFCKAVGTDVIEKLPDNKMPAIIIYENGACCKQIFGASLWGLSDDITPENIEWVLWKLGYLKFAASEEDPRPEGSAKVENSREFGRSQNSKKSNNSDDEDDESDKDSDIEATRGYSSTTMEKALYLNKRYHL